MSQGIFVSSRRLPVYLVLGCSESMRGDPIEAVKMGMRLLRSDLQSDPQALETVWISVITFDSTAKQVVPLTEIGEFQVPRLEAGGSRAMGDALVLLMQRLDQEVRKDTPTQKGDWKPLIFLMIDGQPDPGWEGPADELKRRRPGNVIACAAGSGADDKILKRLTEVVIRLQDISAGTLAAFMKWVTITSFGPEAPLEEGAFQNMASQLAGDIRMSSHPRNALLPEGGAVSQEIVFSPRRLPVYLVLDCSGSMAGEPIAAMEMGLKVLLTDLQNNPHALKTVWLSVIAFASTAQPIIPLTDLSEFVPPNLVASGTTALGEAINLLAERIGEEVRATTPNQKGDWKPLVFLLTDGEPTDEWEKPVENFRARGLATIIACGAGPDSNDSTLKRIGDKVVRLKDTQPGTLGAFLKWVTASVATANQVLGTRARAEEQLSDLPEDKGITLLF